MICVGVCLRSCTYVLFDWLSMKLQDISLPPVLSHDPLPPLDSVAAYTRPPRYILGVQLSVIFCFRKKLLFELLGDHLYKSSAVAEMGDRGHNRHGPKRGCAVPCSAEHWERVKYNVACAEINFCTKWRLHPSSRLATIV